MMRNFAGSHPSKMKKYEMAFYHVAKLHDPDFPGYTLCLNTIEHLITIDELGSYGNCKVPHELWGKIEGQIRV